MEVLYLRCAGLDVHKAAVVAAVRLVDGGKVVREVRTTFLPELMMSSHMR
jgi:transposase